MLEPNYLNSNHNTNSFPCKMSSLILVAFVLSLACGLSTAELLCYSCTGKDSECPVTLTETAVDLPEVECKGVLATSCSKISLELVNGEIYTSRGCSPTFVEAVSSPHKEFCTFIQSLYAPLVTEGIIVQSTCSVCNDSECNV